jgi:tRNA (Thr-GGU) A37 N-methylase
LAVRGILRIELRLENVDVLDGTPLLDIKPYVPEFDEHSADRAGWMEKAKGDVRQKRSDSRFVSPRQKHKK